MSTKWHCDICDMETAYADLGSFHAATGLGGLWGRIEELDMCFKCWPEFSLTMEEKVMALRAHCDICNTPVDGKPHVTLSFEPWKEGKHPIPTWLEKLEEEGDDGHLCLECGEKLFSKKEEVAGAPK